MGHLGMILLFIPLLNCLNHVWGFPPPACGVSQASCRNGSCVPLLLLCDGHRDCEDGADELGCHQDDLRRTVSEPEPLQCRKDEFACLRMRRCVSLRFRCDGVDDCGDGGSDEASCGDSAPPRPLTPPTPPPPPTLCSASSEFRCGDGQCVPHAWRCDRSPDCADASDEDDCDQNECLENNGGCSHLCVDLPLGFLCDCPAGMRLLGDSRCEHIDKCLDTDMCSQLCVHDNGVLSCLCHEGYLLNPRTGECQAKGAVPQLVFSSGEGVRQVSTSAGRYREVAPQLLGPGPLAAHTRNHTLYWAGPGRGAIYRVSMDVSSQQPSLVLEGRGSVSGLAVDWIHDLLYWTDSDTQSINVAPLDGSTRRLLIGGLAQPTGVAVEPLLGLLFWAEGGGSPRIGRAYLDGQGSKALVTSAIRTPVAISLDMTRQLLYWADSGLRSISRVGYDGQHRKTVLESNGYLDRPVGLAVFEGHVYWTDAVTQSLCNADKHNGSLFRVLLPSLASPGGLALVHPVLQPRGPAACGSLQTVCSQRCEPDLFAEMRQPQFICIPRVKGDANGRDHADHTGVSQTGPVRAPGLSDTTFAGILSLIVFLSVVLGGVAVWWCREEFRPARTLTSQDISLKESQDPLIQARGGGKDSLPRLDVDRD